MGVVAFVLIVVGLVTVLAGAVGAIRGFDRSQVLPREIRALRARYGLDGPRWAEVRRSVHRGVAAPDPLRPAAREYAAALLATPGGGTGTGWLGVTTAGALVQSVGGLLDQLDSDHRGLAGLTGAAVVMLGSALVLQLVLRRRRPARAAAALAASR